jgi:hypothetical protein
MNDFLYKHPLIVTWGLVLGTIAAVMGVYNAYLQANIESARFTQINMADTLRLILSALQTAPAI